MSDTPTPVRLAELRRLASEATPGPWELWDGCSWRRFGSAATGRTVVEPIVYSERDRHPDLKVSKADGEHIAACDPQTILALLDMADRCIAAEGERDRLAMGDVNSRREYLATIRAENAELNRQVGELRHWVHDLQSGMFINCVYCGHRYGPKDEVPCTMADALKAHVEQCPKHPMSALKSENAELRRQIEGHETELSNLRLLVALTETREP